MNPAYTRMADLAAMAVSILVAIFWTLKVFQKGRGSLRAGPLFFTLFGPAAIVVHMLAHIAAVGFVASQKWAAGTFSYDFRFYSLLLMAGVLGYLGMQMLQQATLFCLHGPIGKKPLLATGGLIVLVAGPTIPFTFIGSLPVQGVIISLVASFFVRKRRTAKEQITHQASTVLVTSPAEVAS